jgi:hypothetical protein
MAGPWQWGFHTPSQTWNNDAQQGSGGGSGSSNWRQDSYESSPAGKKEKAEKGDRFKSITSLGQLGKHPLPLEDRKALLMAILNELSPQKNVLTKMAVASFTATTTHTLLYWLTHAIPRTPVRILRDHEQVFTIEYAAHSLAEAALSIHGQHEALADPRWVRGAPGFRFDSDLVQVWIKFGPDLVQIWVRFGSDLVHIWLSFGS